MLTPSVAAVQDGKVFILLRGELEGRLDTNFYSIEFKVSNRASFTTLGIGAKSIIHPPEYPREFSNKGFQLIRSQNVRPLGLSLSENPVFFSEELLIGKKVIFPKKGDVLIVRSGVNAGDVAIIEEDIENAIVGADTLLVRCKEQFLPKFLQVYFHTNVGKKQISRHTTGATNKHLNSENLAKVLIPNLDIEEQKKAILVFENALIVKKEKEAEAKQLLTSIDDYLLNALGITMPEAIAKKKTFFMCSDKVQGKRFDPFYYANQDYKIEGGIYENRFLKTIATLDKGQSITKDSIVEGEYPVIAGGQTSPYSHQNYNQKENVITVSASGAYSGYVWFHDYRIFASDCTVIRSKNEEDISTQFLFEILKLKQKEIYNMQQGAGQPHVYASDLEKLKIPLPRPSIQKEIAAHISALRENAKASEEEAKTIIEVAKAEVEKMILGEGGEDS